MELLTHSPIKEEETDMLYTVEINQERNEEPSPAMKQIKTDLEIMELLTDYPIKEEKVDNMLYMVEVKQETNEEFSPTIKIKTDFGLVNADAETKDCEKFDRMEAHHWQIKHEEMDLTEENLEVKGNSMPACTGTNGNQEPPVLRKDARVRQIKCDWCNYETTKKSNLRGHLNRMHTTDRVFRCGHCDFQTIHKSSLKIHLLKHEDPERNTKFKCGECDFETFYRACLKNHLLTHEKKMKTYKCTTCDFETVRRSSISNHIKRHKIAINKFRCAECNFETIHSYSFNNHVLRHKKA